MALLRAAGPLLALGGSEAEDVQHGIISFGIGCAQPGVPGVCQSCSRLPGAFRNLPHSLYFDKQVHASNATLMQRCCPFPHTCCTPTLPSLLPCLPTSAAGIYTRVASVAPFIESTMAQFRAAGSASGVPAPEGAPAPAAANGSGGNATPAARSAVTEALQPEG